LSAFNTDWTNSKKNEHDLTLLAVMVLQFLFCETQKERITKKQIKGIGNATKAFPCDITLIEYV